MLKTFHYLNCNAHGYLHFFQEANKAAIVTVFLKVKLRWLHLGKATRKMSSALLRTSNAG